jgi:hypothetical protein
MGTILGSKQQQSKSVYEEPLQMVDLDATICGKESFGLSTLSNAPFRAVTGHSAIRYPMPIREIHRPDKLDATMVSMAPTETTRFRACWSRHQPEGGDASNRTRASRSSVCGASEHNQIDWQLREEDIRHARERNRILEENQTSEDLAQQNLLVGQHSNAEYSTFLHGDQPNFDADGYLDPIMASLIMEQEFLNTTMSYEGITTGTDLTQTMSQVGLQPSFADAHSHSRDLHDSSTSFPPANDENKRRMYAQRTAAAFEPHVQPIEHGLHELWLQGGDQMLHSRTQVAEESFEEHDVLPSVELDFAGTIENKLEFSFYRAPEVKREHGVVPTGKRHVFRKVKRTCFACRMTRKAVSTTAICLKWAFC